MLIARKYLTQETNKYFQHTNNQQQQQHYKNVWNIIHILMPLLL